MIHTNSAILARQATVRMAKSLLGIVWALCLWNAAQAMLLSSPSGMHPRRAPCQLSLTKETESSPGPTKIEKRQTLTNIGDVPAMTFNPTPNDDPIGPNEPQPPPDDDDWFEGTLPMPTIAFGPPYLDGMQEDKPPLKAKRDLVYQAPGAKACRTGQDNWGNCVAADRKVITLRPSMDDKDDISAEFEKGLRAANNGGLLKLEKDKTFIIGKTLNLTWLNDVYVQVEGTIKVSNFLRRTPVAANTDTSSRMTSSTGRPTMSITRFRGASRFGSGVAKT